jgi:hypothetical protein
VVRLFVMQYDAQAKVQTPETLLQLSWCPYLFVCQWTKLWTIEVPPPRIQWFYTTVLACLQGLVLSNTILISTSRTLILDLDLFARCRSRMRVMSQEGALSSLRQAIFVTVAL